MLLALPAVALAAYNAEDYASDAVHHRKIATTASQRGIDRSDGAQDPKQWNSWNKRPGVRPKRKDSGMVRCRGGMAITEPRNAYETVRCNNSAAASGYRTMHIIDITDLVDPMYTGYYECTDVKAIDHRLRVSRRLRLPIQLRRWSRGPRRPFRRR